ncbi:MAG: type II toxin-antitoxin system VapC family toxin [Deltaproteobacteria bacterium]|nr:type II toxin-antitoxin system VapC family toxin [Deltaproteobacteria bacterium]
MSWVVDTCILIDIARADPDFAEASSRLLRRRLREGLVICPITYVEMGPAFAGSRDLQDEFLAGVGVDWPQAWSWTDTLAAYEAWHAHIGRRREQATPKRPIADVLIGAFAARFEGLLTRNSADFRKLFPRLRLNEP